MQHKERISSFHQWPGLLPEKKHKFQYELLKVNFSITSKFITGTFFRDYQLKLKANTHYEKQEHNSLQQNYF